MLISYPILTATADFGTPKAERDYVVSQFPDPQYGLGMYPLSGHLRWHGGIHIPYGTEPIRAIADGKVAYVGKPQEKSNDPNHPLNYGSPDDKNLLWTDNGCVVIEHVGETGEHTQFRYWSVYMHLAKVKVEQGKAVSRKDVIGWGGTISGKPFIHFEVFTDDAGIKALVKRGDEPVKIFKTDNNEGDSDLWGDMQFVLPAGIDIYDHSEIEKLLWRDRKATHLKAEKVRIAALKKSGKAKKGDPALKPAEFKEPEPPAPKKTGPLAKKIGVSLRYSKGCCVTDSYNEDGSYIGSVSHPDATYEYNLFKHARTTAPDSHSAAYELLRFGRIVGPDALTPANAQHWQYICYDKDKHGWVNLNQPSIQKLSDADFPYFLGWKLVKDLGTGNTEDGRCCAKTVLDLLDENKDGTVNEDEAKKRLNDANVRLRLRRLVCQFDTEWNEADFDARYAFLKQEGKWGDGSERLAMNAAEYSRFKAHANAQQWWGKANLGIDKKVWHFHPIEFIEWMRKCGWVDKAALQKLYPKTSEAIRERYRPALNRVMQKYLITSALRKSHFFGQGAIESGFLTSMQEASMKGKIKNPMSLKSEVDLGHWYGKLPDEIDPYFSSDKVNSKGVKFASSYSWKGGNCGGVDAQKFRGRGFKQLTGRANYSAYWVYRGWLRVSDFDGSWWLDPQYLAKNVGKMKKRPAPIEDPDRIVVTPYNCIDSGGYYITFERPTVKQAMDAIIGSDDGSALVRASRTVTYAINGGYIQAEDRLRETKHAMEILL